MVIVACPSDDRLAAFAGGELASADLDSLAAHLETCPACQRRLGYLDAQSNAILGALRAEPVTLHQGYGAGATQPVQPPATQTEDRGSVSGPQPRTVIGRRGTPPPSDQEIYELYYRRARLGSVVMTAVFAVLLLMLLGDFHPLFSHVTLGWPAVVLFGVVLVFSTARAVILRVCPNLSVRAYRRLTLAQAGLLAAAFSYKQVILLTLPAPGGPDGQRLAESQVYGAQMSCLLHWLFLIASFGVVMPETWRRTALAGLVFSALSSAALVAGVVCNPAVRQQWFVLASLSAIFLTAGTVLSVMASFQIDVLQREVQKTWQELRELGPYQLLERIGSGGMGEVYLARHRLLKRPCAVKLIAPERASDPELLERFEREVHATAQLTHVNTVEVYDYGRTGDGTFYYVMEYLPGLTLEELVKRYGPLPPARAVHFLRQLCGALGEAHGIGLIHRDLKPGNAIVCKYGGRHDVLKLLDFGLVRLPGTDTASHRLTQTGVVLGTPDYMAPEQARGGPADPRSDLYSLGAVAYFLLTGRPPFPRDSVLETLMAHLREPPAQIAGVPAELEAVVLRCLAKIPAERFADVRELEDALARCAAVDAWTEAQAAAWRQAIV